MLLTSLLGYLQWGGDHYTYLFCLEVQILSKVLGNPLSYLHPLISIPMTGQVLLTITLFQKAPGRKLTIAGMLCVGILIGLIFVIGVITGNLKILASAIPFLCMACITSYHLRMNNKIR